MFNYNLGIIGLIVVLNKKNLDIFIDDKSNKKQRKFFIFLSVFFSYFFYFYDYGIKMEIVALLLFFRGDLFNYFSNCSRRNIQNFCYFIISKIILITLK